jgi:hypothetical protein
MVNLKGVRQQKGLVELKTQNNKLEDKHLLIEHSSTVNKLI